MEQRVALFDRAVRFKGRPRERMIAISIADELFAHLYPHSFRSELIIKMADLGDRASSERREAMRAHEGRCAGHLRGLIDAAVVTGDLPPTAPVSQIMFAIVTIVIGTHTITSNFASIVADTGITNPFLSLRDNIQVLLDGFGWKPLASEWDYGQSACKILTEVFPNEWKRIHRA
jgi:hypothetical protein